MVGLPGVIVVLEHGFIGHLEWDEKVTLVVVFIRKHRVHKVGCGSSVRAKSNSSGGWGWWRILNTRGWHVEI